MTPRYQRHGVSLFEGDALEVMPRLETDPERTVVITDPVWPNAPKGMFPVEDPWELFARAAAEVPRLARRLVVVLGCDSDVRFLAAVPKALRYVRTCWLRYEFPSAKGTVLNGSDVAYIFGDHRATTGATLIAGESSTAAWGKDHPVSHPCPRKVHHMRWLVERLTRPGDVVLDPFAGSGTTLEALRPVDDDARPPRQQQAPEAAATAKEGRVITSAHPDYALARRFVTRWLFSHRHFSHFREDLEQECAIAAFAARATFRAGGCALESWQWWWCRGACSRFVASLRGDAFVDAVSEPAVNPWPEVDGQLDAEALMASVRALVTSGELRAARALRTAVADPAAVYLAVATGGGTMAQVGSAFGITKQRVHQICTRITAALMRQRTKSAAFDQALKPLRLKFNRRGP